MTIAVDLGRKATKQTNKQKHEKLTSMQEVKIKVKLERGHLRSKQGKMK